MPAGPDRLPTRVSRLQEHTTPALICLATGPSQTKARPEIAEKDWQTFSQITRTTDNAGIPYPCISIRGGVVNYFPIFGTRKRSAFSTNAQSRFASAVLDGVLGPPLRLAGHT